MEILAPTFALSSLNEDCRCPSKLKLTADLFKSFWSKLFNGLTSGRMINLKY